MYVVCVLYVYVGAVYVVYLYVGGVNEGYMYVCMWCQFVCGFYVLYM